jgi:hypothetical protein
MIPAICGGSMNLGVRSSNLFGRANVFSHVRYKPGFLARERSVTLEELRARREIDINEECPKELGDGARQ